MKILKRFILLTTIILSILPKWLNVQAQDQLTVMTTFYPVYYLAEVIGGDVLNVEMLLDQGQDAHSYESSAQDAVKIQESDLFIYQDDEMEFFVNDLLTIIDLDATLVLESTEGIDLLSGEEEEHTDHDHTHDYDPHTWLDPIVYAQQAENIRDAFINLDPDNQAIYAENTSELLDALNELDQTYAETLATLDNRTIVVQHAAFGYLMAAYDLEQVAITGLSSSNEPSAKQLAEMQDFVLENNVSVIYVDPSLSTSISEAVSSATGAELRPLRTLEVVTTEEIEAGIDYFTIMEENLTQLIK